MKKRILLVLVLKFGLTVGGLAQAATITVGPEVGYDFDTIQAGIDIANGGDTVLVAPGEYVITEPITFRGKAITVKSETDPDETTIRMDTPADTHRGSVVVFENNETTESVLEGFTITGGKGSWVPSQSTWAGGGIFFDASSGTLRNCVILQNRTENAGGVCCGFPCSPTLIDCLIKENSAGGVGGGVVAWESSPILTNCVITENSSLESIGGGVWCGQNSSMTMTDCVISGNSAEADGGGGVACWYGSVTMTRCSVVGNTAQDWFGGGVYAGHSPVTLTNCIITRNTAPLGGGGVCSSYADAFITINNCTIWGNSVGSEYGGGVLCRNASAMVTNSIVWGNTSAKGREISVEDAASTLNIACSNVAGGQTGVSVESGCVLDWGEGNIDADPLFADATNGDYHLRSQAGRLDPESQTWIQDELTSPCIDNGDPMSPIGWEPFSNGGFINMGAYGGTPEASKTYFGEPICETIVAGDINGDGQVNRADLEIMALHWTDEEPLQLP